MRSFPLPFVLLSAALVLAAFVALMRPPPAPAGAPGPALAPVAARAPLDLASAAPAPRRRGVFAAPESGEDPVPAPATDVASVDAPRLCVEEPTLLGLVLDPAADEAAFERAFGARPRADLVLARHRIRKLFHAAPTALESFRALLPDPAVVGVLARQQAWLSARLASEPVDPHAVLVVAGAAVAPEDDAALARRYAGACDEWLGIELDRIERALAAENERGLDQRIALGLHRVRHQPAEF